ncbi:MAG TPA: prepilin-type N-terminal cleavage/methylation domain-containing protein, partial [Nonomuraea sp.]|nr:prepilin-type N-terminal cleavage/methylation domain-containing protein [Nonomuraea sp.]
MKMKREAGFTLIELLVSLAVTAVLILGVLATFDFSARMNRVQLNVADMQQSLRIAQNEIVKLARMTGRGSLPRAIAIDVRNNVPANYKLISGAAATGVLEGTDVVTMRGVFNSSLYQIEYLNSKVWDDPDAAKDGWVVVLPTAAGVPQDLDALRGIAKTGETLLLVTPFGVTSVAKISADSFYVPITVSDEDDEDSIPVTVDGLKIKFTKHLQEASLGTLAPGLPAVAQVGVLEEHVFYVRSTGAAGDAPSLARARMDPGTGQAYKGDVDTYAILDIADNIADLQVSLPPLPLAAGVPELRVSTLARTDRADAGNYQATLLPATIEDHAYAANHPF